MKNSVRFLVSALLITTFVINALPCGPGYISPVFEYENAPENPYVNFAAGRLGILTPGMHRSVLYAAYRYLNGGGFNAPEQEALVDVWRMEFDNKDFRKDDIGEAVKAWIEKRKEIVGKEEKTPDIYADRSYGGYDFFPNCTKNAFEVATQTLSDRAASYGSDGKDVKTWIATQDRVFENCASGKDTPEEPDPSMPEWLQKDRVYQIAAAKFYSLDYEDAKKRFAQIAQDGSSPWRDTADYLVGRTLIRQASLTKDEARAELYYTEAEQELAQVANAGNKFSDSAVGLLGLVKFRLHPKERVRELARNLTYGSNEDFRQNLIDYNWLLDKFEKDELEKEEKRKEAEKAAAKPASNANTSATNIAVITSSNVNTSISGETAKRDDDLNIQVYLVDLSKSIEFNVRFDATDDDAIAEAEKVLGRPLTDDQKKQVRALRQAAYVSRFTDKRGPDYPGGYYGEEKTSLKILPSFIREDDLTDWLFTYQIGDDEAYNYSLSKYRETSSDVWLMTALSKAKGARPRWAGLSRRQDALVEPRRVTRRSPITRPVYTWRRAGRTRRGNCWTRCSSLPVN